MLLTAAQTGFAAWQLQIASRNAPFTKPTRNALQNTLHNLQGGIPAAWAHPNATWNLTELYCNYCGLNGTLPATWSMPSLKILDLNGNTGLTGGFSQLVAGSPAVTLLVMHATGLRDTMDDTWQWDAMTQLDLLDLGSNPGVTGVLPYSELLVTPRG